ncbi:hypothetical protein LGW17_09525 [Streptococcus mutans]|nr:hypothetical protein [Streptococcus mutans]MCB4997940.1 hypothetical protein [Streptococcus mutans]MCB5039534.1 hypothetical protein [Streptococcus mutans]MCB5065557.1 hypothetical protein [Streptococcus mutans]MCB5109982.1 hypothetical protein [Streptococcus mutans]
MATEQNEIISRKGDSPSPVRKRAFNVALYNRQKENLLAKKIKTQLSNTTHFFEELQKRSRYELNLTQFAEKLASGEVQFMRKNRTGESLATLVDSVTNKTYAQVPIKSVPVELGASIATAGLAQKLEELSAKLDLLENKINQVNRNFDLNRYAEVLSAKEKYETALLIQDFDTRKQLLREAYSQATNAKNLLLQQIYDSKYKIEERNKDERNKNKLQKLTSRSKTKEDNELAETTLMNLQYLKDAFSFQIGGLTELQEYEALNYYLLDFENIILDDFSSNDALLLDEFTSNSKNPFKFFSSEVLESTKSLTEFIANNDDLLEVHFIPEQLIISQNEEEIDSEN